MAAPEEEVVTQEETPKTTYKSFAEERPTAIDSMWYVMRHFGKELPYDDKEGILNAFLTKNRYFETNIGSTASTLFDVKNMDDDTKKMYAYALKNIEDLPSIFEKGGAPTGKALADYALAGVTDPTNLLSAVTSFFTLGASGAAIQGGKTAAQQTVKELLKSKIKAAVSQEALKAMAVEGTVAATGGAAQNYLKQEVEQDLGLRGPDKDYAEMALQGALEGTLSPLAGVVANVMGSVAVKSSKDLLDTIPAAQQAIAWTKRNFLPAAGLDEGSVRIMERNNGQLVPVNERATELQEIFDKSLIKSFGENPDKPALDIINRALENDAGAVADLTKLSPESAKLLPEIWSLRDEASVYGMASNLNTKTKGLFANNGNYIRNVPEAYYVFKREPFEKFIEKNPNILDTLENAIMQDATLPREKRYFGEISDKFIDSSGNIPAGISKDNIKKIVREEAEKLYGPTRRYRTETATFGQREQVPDVVKEIIGYNNKPALRIADTVSGIMTTAARSNLAADLGAHSIEIGKGVSAPDMATARAKLGGKEVVPLVGGFDDKFKPLEKQVSPIRLPVEYVDPKLRTYYVTKDYADQLSDLFKDTPFMSAALNDSALGQAYKSVLTIQNLAKAGKTVYSPMAHIRNLVGAAGYMWTSGNVRGLASSIREFTKFSAPAQKAAWERFEALGLKGSNIDLNQVMRRLGDLSGVADDRLLSKVLYLGKVGKKFREGYEFVDNVAKFGVFLNEERKSQKIFDKLSSAERSYRLDNFKRAYNKPNATFQDVIAEEAARKTAMLTPIYDRIPLIFEKTRAIPVVGSFVAYPAERLRNVYNILKLSTDEMREGFRTGNSELTKAGIARLAQFYTAQGSLYAAAYAANEMIGASKVVDSLRSSLLPEYQKDHPILITGKNKDGYYKMVDLGYINPDQYILDAIAPIMIKASRGEDVSKDLDKTLVRAAGKLFEPYISKTLVFQAAEDMAAVAKGDMSRLDNLVKTLEPGAVKMAREMAADSGALDNMGQLGSAMDRFISPRRFGEQKDRADDFFDFMKKSGLVFPGMREEVVDPRKAIGFALNNLKKNTENSWGKFRKEAGAILSDPTATFDPIDMMKSYSEAMKDQFIFQQGVKKLYDDAKDVVPENKVKDLMKSFDLRGVTPSDRDRRAIIAGEYKPMRISQDNKFWVDLNKSFVDKTGENNWEVLRPLRQKFIEIERQYMNYDLQKEPPKLDINKGSKE